MYLAHTQIQVEKVATGFMGLVGNKGGIAIKFHVKGGVGEQGGRCVSSTLI